MTLLAGPALKVVSRGHRDPKRQILAGSPLVVEAKYRVSHPYSFRANLRSEIYSFICSDASSTVLSVASGLNGESAMGATGAAMVSACSCFVKLAARKFGVRRAAL